MVFQTRWALSYLRGPLDPRADPDADGTAEAGAGRHRPASPASAAAAGAATAAARSRQAPAPRRPGCPPWLVGRQPTRACRRTCPSSSSPAGTRSTPERALALPPGAPGRGPAPLRRQEVRRRPLGDAGAAPAGRRGDAGRRLGRRRGTRRPASPSWTRRPSRAHSFAPLAAPLSRAKCYAEWTKALKNYLYRERKLTIWSCPELKAYSRPAEIATRLPAAAVAGLSRAARPGHRGAPSQVRAEARPGCRRRSARPASGWTESRPRRASRRGTPPSHSATRSSAPFSAARRSARRTWARPRPPPRPPAGPCRRAAMSARPRPQLDRALEKFTDLEIEFQAEVETLEATRRPEALAHRADRADSQEGRHHRRAGRPGLDAVDAECRRDRPSGLLKATLRSIDGHAATSHQPSAASCFLACSIAVFLLGRHLGVAEVELVRWRRRGSARPGRG